MKKQLLLLVMMVLPLVASADVAINEENFPDANFRTYLLTQWYGYDMVITNDEINSIDKIKVDKKAISSLKGIEFFTALTILSCIENQLTSLDLSNNIALTQLSCWSNLLTSLDVSNCTELTFLACESNRLTSLDVSKCTALTEFRCDHNQLSSLDVTHNISLKYFTCSNNQLASLDVTHNIAITFLGCNDNQLTSLDVTHNTVLKGLDVQSNHLIYLDVSKNTALGSMMCWSNSIFGTNMDKLINDLPIKEDARIYIISTGDENEKNVCTKLQVEAAKSKGWTVYSVAKNDWPYDISEYTGSEPSAVGIISSESVKISATYTLGGSPADSNSHGLSIVRMSDGMTKKVIVK